MTDVPCRGCTACCRDQIVVLFPEIGDDPATYETVEYGGVFALKDRQDGACIYLGPGGCSIYERRPAVCREFDCRKDFLAESREYRRIAARQSPARAAIYAAARKRLNTLSPEERRTALARRGIPERPGSVSERIRAQAGRVGEMLERIRVLGRGPSPSSKDEP